MFIGGLSWQTAPEGLREYFSKFGDITEVMVMKDPTTRRSRGFGFVTFADPSSVDKVLTNGPHELDGKKIDPKIAFPKRAHPKMVTRTKKVFVGGLSAPTTLEDVKNYFQQFGRVSLLHHLLCFTFLFFFSPFCLALLAVCNCTIACPSPLSASFTMFAFFIAPMLMYSACLLLSSRHHHHHYRRCCCYRRTPRSS